MLVLTRKMQEKIQIGDNITITILRVKGRTVRVGITAPKGVRVMRPEILNKEADKTASAVAEHEPAVSSAGELSLSLENQNDEQENAPLPQTDRLLNAAPLSLHISRRFRIISPDKQYTNTNVSVATAAVAAN